MPERSRTLRAAVTVLAHSGTLPGDQDSFNGAYDRLQAPANG